MNVHIAHQPHPPDGGFQEPNPNDENEEQIEWTTAAANNLQLPLVHDEDSDPYELIEWDTRHDWRTSNFHFNNASATVEELEGHLQAQLNNDQPFK